MEMITVDGKATESATRGQLSVLRSLGALGNDGQASANLVGIWDLPAGCRRPQVGDAWWRLVEAHESLRTTFNAFHGHDTVPTQTVHQVTPVPLEVVDLAEAGKDAVSSVAASASAEAFDIRSGLPWRARIVTSAQTPRCLVVVVHHAAADNAALGILGRQFLDLLGGGELPRQPQPQELARLEKTQADASESAVEHLTDAWPGFLSEDRRTDDHSVRRRAEVYSAEALKAVHEISSRSRVSLQSAVFAAGVVALARVTGRTTFTFSLMAANRLDQRWSQLISSLNQCAPLTVSVDEDAPVDSYIRSNYYACLQAYMHGAYDVDALRRRLRTQGIETDPTFFAKHFNFLGDMEEEPPSDAMIRSVVSTRYSKQRSGPNLHLVTAVGEGLYIGVGASEDLLPGDRAALVAAGTEAALISMARCGDGPLNAVSTRPVRPVEAAPPKR